MGVGELVLYPPVLAGEEDMLGQGLKASRKCWSG